jgi:hypothetical protein
MGAKTSTKNRDPMCLQQAPSQPIQIGSPMARSVIRKESLVGLASLDKCLTDFSANLVGRWPNGRPQPGEESLTAVRHHFHRRFDHATGQPSPAGVHCPNLRAVNTA